MRIGSPGRLEQICSPHPAWIAAEGSTIEEPAWVRSAPGSCYDAWVLVSPSDKSKCCELFPWLRHSSHPGPAVPTSKLSLIHNHTPVNPYFISAPPPSVTGYFGFQGSLSLPSAPFHLIDRHSLPLLPCRVPTPIIRPRI